MRYALQNKRVYLCTHEIVVSSYTQKECIVVHLFSTRHHDTFIHYIASLYPITYLRPTRLPFVLFFCAHNIKCLVRCLRSYFSTCPSCPTLATTYISNYCFMRSSMYCQQRYMAADLYIASPMTCCCNQ